MSIDIGIIGLPESGKTTIFNALTGGKADTGTSSSHLGVARVPDARLGRLAEILHPRRVVTAEVRYVDIGASDKGHTKEKGIGGHLLAELANVDELINVVRAFPDESIPHIKGSLDIARDIAAMDTEVTFSDLAIIERRLEKIETSLKAAKPSERQAYAHEQALLHRIKADLEKDIPIREQKLTAEEFKSLSGYQFLTAKPLLILVNIGEGQLTQAASIEAGLNTSHASPRCRAIAFCGKLEMELAQLEEDIAAGFRAEYKMSEPGAARVIRASYELLGLISFFTVVSGEIRAWSVSRDTQALKAAGKIHSDMEKGFIRAEVISFDDMLRYGSMAEARKRGMLRLEGKTYAVQDGDIITFLFNV
ncbi:MAG: redox-regulated ATPase YchF [Chloroflexi bacterium]|nr:redox-regulated ATPase YchF [Chloroflexota bacterium]